MTRRALKLKGLDQELEISKAIAINSDIPTILSIDRLHDGTYKLLFNAKVIPDYRLLEAIEIIRED